MLKFLRKLQYGARVLLARGGGQQETVEVAGRQVSIRSGGEGPPFVYLHSTLAESMFWLPFHQRWARKFRVLAPMHPGFGTSGGFEEVDDIGDMAYAYVELFDALGLEEVILGGVSLGGWIAAEFAVRWPERVKKLWLSGAPGLWVEEEPLGNLFHVVQDRDKLREMLFHDPNGAMAGLVIKDAPSDEEMQTGYRHMASLAHLVWKRPYDPKLAHRLHRVQCPTLLLWGDHDRLVPPAYGEAYRRHLPQAKMHLIRDCGHLAMFEKETEFVDAIARFALEE